MTRPRHTSHEQASPLWLGLRSTPPTPAVDNSQHLAPSLAITSLGFGLSICIEAGEFGVLDVPLQATNVGAEYLSWA